MTSLTPIAIGVADIGHPNLRNGSHFGAWLTSDADEPPSPPRPYASPADFGTAAGEELAKGARLIIGFEAPRSVNVGPYGVERPVEAGYGKEWFRGSGGTVFVLAESQVPAILHAARQAAGQRVTATVRPERWHETQHIDVLLVEGFVTGSAKVPVPTGWTHGGHAWDAKCVVDAIDTHGPLHTNTQRNCDPPKRGVPIKNNLVADALWAGMDIDPTEIRHPGVVIRPCPPQGQCDVVGGGWGRPRARSGRSAA